MKNSTKFIYLFILIFFSFRLQAQSNTDVVCQGEEVDFNDFQTSWGIWNDGGSDCYRYFHNEHFTSLQALNGLLDGRPFNYAIRLRDNSGRRSSMFTDIIDLSGSEKVQIDFEYVSFNFVEGEDFMLEYSLDGGNSWIISQSWISGTNLPDQTVEQESVTIDAVFTADTRFRIRCDALNNADRVYIDNVRITKCAAEVVDPCPLKNVEIVNNGECDLNYSTDNEPILSLNSTATITITADEGDVLTFTSEDQNYTDTYQVSSECDQLFTALPICIPECEEIALYVVNEGECVVYFSSNEEELAEINPGEEFRVDTEVGQNYEIESDHEEWGQVIEVVDSNEECEQVYEVIPECQADPVIPPSTECQYTTHDFIDLESGWGIWNDGGSDCYRLFTSDNISGNYVARLRDNSGRRSSMITDIMNLTGTKSVRVSFGFRTFGFSEGEDFMLEYSLDGGSTYAVVQTWVNGIDFSNENPYQFETATIEQEFNSTTVLRFRCDASSNRDRVYIDDVRIQTCNGDTPIEPSCDQVVSEEYSLEGFTFLSGSQVNAACGDNIILNATGTYSGYIFDWNGPSQFIQGSAGNVDQILIQNAMPSNSGIYTATWTDRDGCTGELLFEVTVSECVLPCDNAISPSYSILNGADISNNQVNLVCGDNVTLDTDGDFTGWTFVWTGPGPFNQGSGVESDQITFTSAMPSMSGDYALSWTDPQGCMGSLTMAIAVADCAPICDQILTEEYKLNNDAIVSGSSINTICGSNLTLGAQGTFAGWTFDWSGPGQYIQGVGASIDEIAFVDLGPSDAGTYVGSWTDPQGCTGIISFDLIVDAVAGGVGVDFRVNNGPWTPGKLVTVNCGDRLQIGSPGQFEGWIVEWTGSGNYTQGTGADIDIITFENVIGSDVDYYMATYTNPNGCSTIMTINVLMNNTELAPEYNVNNTGVIVSNQVTASTGDEVTLGAQGSFNGWTFDWTGPAAFTSGSGDNIDEITITSLTSSHDGLYTATWTDPNGCSGTFSIDLVVNNSPVFEGASTRGVWGNVISGGMVPVSIANLPNGDILCWSAYDEFAWGGNQGKTVVSIFDLETETFSTPTTISHTNHDMFCPGTANLSTGEVLVSGGSSSDKTTIYNPFTNEFSVAPKLNETRGYHSMCTLDDGRVFTLGGSFSGGARNKKAEVFSINTGWRSLANVDADNTLKEGSRDPGGILRFDNHAWLWSVPGGRVFVAGPASEMHWVSTEGQGTVTDAGPRGDDDHAMKGNTVMYEQGKLLKTGGAPSYSGAAAQNRAYTIDISDGMNAVVNRVQNLKQTRTYHNSVVLPNGEVMVVGGTSFATLFTDANARKTPELFNPNTGTFSDLAPHRTARNYHSVALILQDGRVWSGGGGLCGVGCAANHPDAEIFTPPYLFDSNDRLATRPVIITAPDAADYSTQIDVSTNTNVDEFVLIRLSATTHATNNDQRRIVLTHQSNGNNTYGVNIPERGWVPPGYYFLFTLKNGVPSIAKVIKVGQDAATPGANASTLNDGTFFIEGLATSSRVASPEFDKANVRMVEPSNSDDQKWEVSHIGDGAYTLKNVATSEFLKVDDLSKSAIKNVGTDDNHTSSEVKWFITKEGNDYIVQPVSNTDKALDCGSGKHKNVNATSFSIGNNQQRFKFINIYSDQPSPHLKEQIAAAAEVYLHEGDVEMNKGEDGAITLNGIFTIKSHIKLQNLISPKWEDYNARMYPAHTIYPEHKWEIKHVGDNKHLIKNTSTNRYLQVDEMSCENGVNVSTSEKSEGNKTLWYIDLINGTHYIVPASCSSLALDQNAFGVNSTLLDYDQYNNNLMWDIIPAHHSDLEHELESYSNDLRATPVMDNQTELIWMVGTQDKTNVKSYIIQYLYNSDFADDAIDLYTIDVDENPQGIYSYVHQNPGIGENLYRVKIIYENEEIEYTSFRLVEFARIKEVATIKVGPNPTHDILNVDFSEYRGIPVHYFISSTSGQVIMNGAADSQHSGKKVLNLSKMTPGIYMIHVRPEGHREVSIPFVVAQNQ